MARTNDEQQSTSSSRNSAVQQRGCDSNIAAHIEGNDNSITVQW